MCVCVLGEGGVRERECVCVCVGARVGKSVGESQCVSD